MKKVDLQKRPRIPMPKLATVVEMCRGVGLGVGMAMGCHRRGKRQVWRQNRRMENMKKETVTTTPETPMATKGLEKNKYLFTEASTQTSYFPDGWMHGWSQSSPYPDALMKSSPSPDARNRGFQFAPPPSFPPRDLQNDEDDTINVKQMLAQSSLDASSPTGAQIDHRGLSMPRIYRFPMSARVDKPILTVNVTSDHDYTLCRHRNCLGLLGSFSFNATVVITPSVRNTGRDDCSQLSYRNYNANDTHDWATGYLYPNRPLCPTADCWMEIQWNQGERGLFRFTIYPDNRLSCPSKIATSLYGSKLGCDRPEEEKGRCHNNVPLDIRTSLEGTHKDKFMLIHTRRDESRIYARGDTQDNRDWHATLIVTRECKYWPKTHGTKIILYYGKESKESSRASPTVERQWKYGIAGHSYSLACWHDTRDSIQKLEWTKRDPISGAVSVLEQLHDQHVITLHYLNKATHSGKYGCEVRFSNGTSHKSKEVNVQVLESPQTCRAAIDDISFSAEESYLMRIVERKHSMGLSLYLDALLRKHNFEEQEEVYVTTEILDFSPRENGVSISAMFTKETENKSHCPQVISDSEKIASFLQASDMPRAMLDARDFLSGAILYKPHKRVVTEEQMYSDDFIGGSGNYHGEGSGNYHGEGSGNYHGGGSGNYHGGGSGNYHGGGANYHGGGSGNYHGGGSGNYHGGGSGIYHGRKGMDGAYGSRKAKRDGGQTKMNIGQDDQGYVRLMCHFMYCEEHRTALSFQWTLDGAPLNKGQGSPFWYSVENADELLDDILCTVRQTTMKLSHRDFVPGYFGRYKCAMTIAFGDRLLPWIVSETTDINQSNVPIYLPESVDIYPKRIYTYAGTNVKFYCRAVNANSVAFELVKLPEVRNDGGESERNVTRINATLEKNGNTTAVLWSVNLTISQSDIGISCVANNKNGHDALLSYAEIVLNYGDQVSSPCSEDVDTNGITWSSAFPGSVISLPCPTGYSGLVSRQCNEQSVWSTPSYINCTRVELIAVNEKIDILTNGILEPTSDVLDSLSTSISSSVAKSPPKLSGDLSNIIHMMDKMSTIAANKTDQGTKDKVLVGQTSLESFASITNDLLSADDKVWTSLDDDGDDDSENKTKTAGATHGSMLLASMDSWTRSSLQGSDIDETPIVKKNIVIKRKRLRLKEDIQFPEQKDSSAYKQHEEWTLKGKSSAFLPAKSFEDLNKDVRYSVILYKHLKKRFLAAGQMTEKSLDGLEIATEILSFSINVDAKDLKSELELQFQPLNKNFSNPRCVYLDTDAESGMVWSSNHCRTEMDSDGRIHCYCKHFTNFAVLMDPTPMKEVHHKALGVITLLGCIISIACLCITLITYAAVWRLVASDRSILHVCLCSSLLLVYILFLAGIEQTQHQMGCLLIAVFLHYFLLVAFSVMLTEGIELYIRVIFVFKRKSMGWKLFAPSTLVPLLIVATTVGATWERGYRSPDFCWLNKDSGAVWAFLVPVILVIVMNIVITVLVFRRMLATHAMMNQENRIKVKRILKNICILTPLLGFTWIFGIFAMSTNVMTFYYVFAIFNSLQGLFIFVLYCLLYKQVTDGVKLIVRRFRAQYSSYSLGTQSTGQTSRAMATNDNIDNEMMESKA